jgi:signal transduction histidine kinase
MCPFETVFGSRPRLDSCFYQTQRNSRSHAAIFVLLRDLLGPPTHRDVIESVLHDGRVLIKEAFLIPPYDDPVLATEMQLTADWLRDYISPDEEAMEPVSDIFYPILESMKEAVQVGGNDIVHAEENDQAHEDYIVEIQGLVALTIYWRDTIKGILPPGSTGIVVVFDNPCNPSFSYQIDGPFVSYMGGGDLHNPKYNDLEQSIHLLDSVNGDKAYSGMPVNSDYCPFTIRVFPSQAMEDDYMSNNPALFTVAAFLIFLTTCAVFIIYDRWVERRQRHVLQSALDATMNVCVLEEMVQERTRKLEASNLQLAEANCKVVSASATQLQHFASMLNCIVGLSSLLVDDASLGSKQKESVRMIMHSSDLLRNVVNDVLDFSKLESGVVTNEMQWINLQETLDTVVYSISQNEVFAAKDLSIRTFYDCNVNEHLWCDGRRLQQILYNLLGNSIKFSRVSGVVELNVSQVVISPQDLEQAVQGQPHPKQEHHEGIRFVVKDYGKGIAKKDFEKIFNPFSQAQRVIE